MTARRTTGDIAAVAVFATFALSGLNFASWAARFPAVRDALEVTPGQFGLLLLIGAAGSILALPVSGMIVERFGGRRTIGAFAILHVLGLLLAGVGVARGEIALVLPAVVLVGIGAGVWDAAMNFEGAAVERVVSRSLMPRFHAGFSVGTMVGAGLGALAARLDLSVLTHLAIVLPVSLALTLFAVSRLLPDAETAGGETVTREGSAKGRAWAAWRERRTLLVGVIVLGAALTEGAANDWISLAVVDDFGVGDEIGALAFGVFVTAMTGMRWFGVGLLDRIGRVRSLMVVSACALAGLTIFVLSPWLPLALVGAVLWGMGAALGFPVGMSAASDDPVHAPARLAVVSTIGYSAFLAGPTLLGFLADHVGYRWALAAVAVPVLAGLMVVRAATPLPAVDAVEEPARD